MAPQTHRRGTVGGLAHDDVLTRMPDSNLHAQSAELEFLDSPDTMRLLRDRVRRLQVSSPSSTFTTFTRILTSARRHTSESARTQHNGMNLAGGHAFEYDTRRDQASILGGRPRLGREGISP